jgi:hypothetical protein
VVVPSGATSATFDVATGAVAATTSATLTASSGRSPSASAPPRWWAEPDPPAR